MEQDQKGDSLRDSASDADSERGIGEVEMISIIIPAHNAENRISKIIGSIRDQTFTDYEIIVIADACTDETAYMCRKLGCVVAEINKGNAGAARNVGLELARGEWIMFADDDDYWFHPFALEQITNELAIIGERVDMLQCAFYWKGRGVTQTTNGRIYPNVWSKVFRREAIGDTRFPEDRWDDDLVFVNAMLAKHIRVMCLPLLWYYYDYMREGSITWRLEKEKKK